MSQVPTIESVEYAIKALKDALSSVQNSLALATDDKKRAVADGCYSDAATLVGTENGLRRAENCIFVEIETLEERRHAITLYLASL